MSTLELVLNNVLMALMRIRVCGEDAGLLDGAIKGVEQALEAVRRAQKEGKSDEAGNE